MNALRSLVGLLMLSGLLLSESRCGGADGAHGDDIVLLVNVRGLLPDVTMLQTRAMLDGVAATNSFEIRQDLSRFTVRLSRQDTERSTLRLEASGHADDRCKLATGETSIELVPGKRSYEADLGLQRLPEKLCTLTVGRSDGGIITSKPAGIFCGDSCVADFPIGSQVELTAQRGTKPIQTSWGIECRRETYGITNTCTVSVNRPVIVNGKVEAGNCSDTGWCWTYPPRGRSLRSIWGSDANHVWAVGAGGTVLKWDGTSWSPRLSGTAKSLSGVWGSSANNVWAVGAGGTVLWWDGRVWTPRESGTTNDLYGVWGSDASHVWAVGVAGTVLRWDGTAWTAQTSSTSSRLESVWGSDARNVWAVGFGGTVIKWDGTAWLPEKTSGYLPTLHSVRGIDASNVWAVGDGGKVIRLNGPMWTAQTSGISTPLYGVWGNHVNDVWAVGYDAVVRWNETTWESQSSNTAQTFMSVWGSDASNVWAVSTDGAILRYYPPP